MRQFGISLPAILQKPKPHSVHVVQAGGAVFEHVLNGLHTGGQKSAIWAQKSDGPAAPTGWIQVSGNEYDSFHGSYLAADGQGFTYEDGEWTFTVTVTHTTHVGDSVLVDSDVCWDLDYEEYADNRNSGGDEFYKAEICKT